MKIGQFLGACGRAVRRRRPRFEVPSVHFSMLAPDTAGIWLPSRGCRFDFEGQCTMCNFGFPGQVLDRHIVDAARNALPLIPPLVPILWMSPFNFFDTTEISTPVAEEILSMVAATAIETMVCETHVLTVEPARIARAVDLLGGKNLTIQFGVESMNEATRMLSINKPCSNATIERAVSITQAAGAEATANLLFGAPFLSAREQVDDVVTSVRKAYSLGFDWVTVFPCFVKPFTVVECLYEDGLYEPPLLWGLVDILMHLHPNEHRRLNFSWLLFKDHPGAMRGAERGHDADTEVWLADRLMRYAATWDPNILSELAQRRSPCRKVWDRRMADTPPPLRERLSTGYVAIATRSLGADWVRDNAGGIEQALNFLFSARKMAGNRLN